MNWEVGAQYHSRGGGIVTIVKINEFKTYFRGRFAIGENYFYVIYNYAGDAVSPKDKSYDLMRRIKIVDRY